jgi:hypothetical protein
VALSRSRNVAATVLVVAVAFAIGRAAVGAREADALVSLSTLTVVDGAVFTSHSGGDFMLARETDVLAAGDTIRTGSGAAAEITYVDGSSVRLDADAELVVRSVRTSNGGTEQTLGRAWRAITRVFTGDSRYQLRTPSLTASVRG